MQNQVLILIDVQQGFASPHFGKRNNPEAEENMEKLLAHCRATGMPIIHVRHSSREANSPCDRTHRDTRISHSHTPSPAKRNSKKMSTVPLSEPAYKHICITGKSIIST
jgi:nicotinamidase-related amidase